MEISDRIAGLGAEIVWVHTEDTDHSVGSAERCMELLDNLTAPAVGWCVGDDGTMPVTGAFGSSKHANPGYDLVVDRTTMNLELLSTHGAGPRNQNLTAQELFDEIRRIARRAQKAPEE